MRIIVVDDEQMFRDLLKEHLTSLGHNVASFPSADSALSELCQSDDVDIVISDIEMPPGISGIELAERLAAQRPQLPVILNTGNSNLRDEAAGKGFPVLAKPYRLANLDGLIAECVGQKT